MGIVLLDYKSLWFIVTWIYAFFKIKNQKIIKFLMKKDIVTQLLSGKIDAGGKYIPFKVNKNTPINEVIRASNKSEHEVMVRENLRLPYINIDRNVFIKSNQEKATLAKIKKDHKALLVKKGYNPNKRLNLSQPANAVLSA